MAVALLFFLHRPWYHIRFLRCPPGADSCRVPLTGAVSGIRVHGYLGVSMFLVCLIVALLILRAILGRIPFLLWPTDQQWLLIAAAVNLAIVASAFATRPGFISPPNPRHLPTASAPAALVAVHWEAAAYTCLALAIAALAAAAANLARRDRQQSQIR